MRHHYLEGYPLTSGAHYGCSNNGEQVLVQLQDENGNQVRVKMSPRQAKTYAELIITEAYLMGLQDVEKD